jgi:hypothetical protein
MTDAKLTDRLEEAFARCRNLEVPLADRLRAFANEVRRLGPHFQAAVDALVSRLAQSNAGATAPQVGEPMPAFVLPDEQDGSSGSRISLMKGRSRWHFITGTGALTVVSTSTLWRALRRRSLPTGATSQRSCLIDKSSRCGSNPMRRHRFPFLQIWTMAMR